MGQFLWQHFLSDESVLQQIVDTVTFAKEKFGTPDCLEIGPGWGALTEFLIPLFQKKVLFEMDERLEKGLKKISDDNTQIIWWDVLVSDVTSYKWYLVVWNLPYYITSPIFRKFFEEKTDFPWWVFLIQKEVGEKIATTTKKKSYLWWLINYYYTIEYCFTVDKNAFTPPPKVQSAVVMFSKREKIPAVPLKRVLVFLEIVSQYSRKTLGKIQKMRIDDFVVWWFSLPENCRSKRLEELWREEIEIICWGEL